MSTRVWWLVLFGAAVVRAAIPLVTLAASGRDLPGLPPYSYAPLHGDAFGLYAATREFLASFGRVSVVTLVSLLCVVGAAAWVGARRWRREGANVTSMLTVALAVSLAVAVIVREMEPAGAAVFGWPLVWAALMLPYRGLSLPLDPDVAFVFGLALSVAAVCVTPVATAYAGMYATGRRSVGVLAAWLFALWPLVTGPLTSGRAWENGQWNVDVGLHLYTEPFSTMLVACALALLLRPRTDAVALAAAGLLLGLATATKLTNGIVAAALVLVVACSGGVRRAIPLALGGLVLLPVVATYWPLGYGPIYEETGLSASTFWSLTAVDEAWSGSLLFTPLVSCLLAAGVALGIVALRARPQALALLLAVIATNVVVYSFYTQTALHPRFLYGALPATFVLVSAGMIWLAGRGARLVREPATAT